MCHVIVWINHEVMNHLNSLRVLHMNVVLLTGRLHEILVYEFPDLTPSLHDQKMVTLGNQVRYNGNRTIAENVAFLIHQVLDKLAVRNHESGVCESLQTENAAKFLSPFGQSGLFLSCLQPSACASRHRRLLEVAIGSRNLMLVTKDWCSRRSCLVDLIRRLEDVLSWENLLLAFFELTYPEATFDHADRPLRVNTSHIVHRQQQPLIHMVQNNENTCLMRPVPTSWKVFSRYVLPLMNFKRTELVAKIIVDIGDNPICVWADLRKHASNRCRLSPSHTVSERGNRRSSFRRDS